MRKKRRLTILGVNHVLHDPFQRENKDTKRYETANPKRNFPHISGLRGSDPNLPTQSSQYPGVPPNERSGTRSIVPPVQL